MLDFEPLRNKEISMTEFVAELSIDDLRRLTNEMVDAILDAIGECVDADLVFEPDDPQAYDAYAEDDADTYTSWTLGHVIVHATASAEEAASIAAELARGVEYHGRSRSEVPWETVTTVEQCRHRLEESRRLRLASLCMWPDHPHLCNTQKYIRGEHVNAIGRYVWGLKHDADHLPQITQIKRQIKAVRSEP